MGLRIYKFFSHHQYFIRKPSTEKSSQQGPKNGCYKPADPNMVSNFQLCKHTVKTNAPGNVNSTGQEY